MNFKEKIAKLIVVIFILSIVGVTLASCSGGGQPVSLPDTETTTQNNAVAILTTEQKKEKFEEIIRNIQNSQTVAEAEPYFYGLDESELPDQIDYIKSFREYNETMLNLIAETDDAFYIVRMDYTVSKENGSTNRSSLQNRFFVKFIDGEWKIDYSSVENSEILKLVNERYDRQFGGEGQTYINFTKVNAVYYFFITGSEKYYFKNTAEAILLCFYQDQEGNLYAVVRLNNGNPAASETFKDVSLKLTDDAIGTIVDTTIQLNETVPAGTAKNITIKIPNYEVYTDTQAWSGVSWSFHCNSSTN